jgi:cytochrome P450
MRADILGTYAGLRDKYGDIVYARLGPYQDYFIFHPDLVKEVLVTRAKCFHKMAWQRRVFEQWNGNSILLSEGDFWLRQRRLVQRAFHPRQFEHYGRVMVDCTQRMLADWGQQAAGTGSVQLDLVKSMTDLTINIIARTMFDADVTGRARQIGEAVSILNDVAMYEMMHPIRLPDWVPREFVKKKKWAIGYLDATIRETIRQRRASAEDHGDLLATLLLAVDEEGDGSGMTDEQVRNESMTLLLAGHDTTAAGLAWLWYVLARYPDVQARVLDELHNELAGRDPTAADVPRLKYTELVLKETLRMYPPAIGTFGRQAVVDTQIGGYPLRRGALVHPLAYALHHDPRWFPAPSRFDPERFAPGRVEQIPAYAYFPFGAGPRICVGNTFASTEMLLILATVLPRFQLSLAPGQGEPELSVMLSLRPKGGLQMLVKERAPAAVGESFVV